jgi:hypothetical protein
MASGRRRDESEKRLWLSLPAGEVQLYWSATNLDDECVDTTLGDEREAPRGWRSRYYGVKEPALSFQLKGSGRMPSRIATVFILGDASKRVQFERDTISVYKSDESELSVKLSPLGEAARLTIIDAKLAEGERVERLSGNRD